MDRLESWGQQLSNLTLYDVKAAYNQARNMVLNVSEMESKVQEATNDEPWGASSTLMTDIAQGTFNFQQFNEIMPAIYSRFMEKEARQWRQIYKALTLLEYIIKHGSERVVDDARSHVSMIKMLRNFHYIDDNGKDQGINVRNRSREITEMLSDVEKIRIERKKAKQNRGKYTGTGNDGGFGSRYGGFGNDYSGGSFSGGGGGGSSSYNADRYVERDHGSRSGAAARSSNFEEYDAGDDDLASPRRSNSTTAARRLAGRSVSGVAASSRTETAPPPPKSQPVVNLLDMDDFDSPAPASAPAASNQNKALPQVSAQSPIASALDDDFDDFQSAPVTSTGPTKASAPVARAPSKQNVFEFIASTSAPITSSSATTAPMQSPPLQPQNAGTAFGTIQPTPNYTSSFTMQPTMAQRPPVVSPQPATSIPGAVAPKSSGGGFDDLWNLSLGSGKSSTTPANQGTGKSMKDLQKEKAQANIWTGQGGGQGRRPPAPASGGFGSFSNSDGDDLLL